MKDRAGVFLAGLFLVILIHIFSGAADSRESSAEAQEKQLDALSRVMVIDGSNVQDVGELLTHVGNWGIFGSMPSAALPFSFAPSAEWPAGSGIEHLYISGLWVGAIRSGLPAVSTSSFEFEFRPTDDPIDIIYRSFEGNTGGSRLPYATADDDGDGTIDEDWLDGHDNDMDGFIDEDYAAISDQMFSCWFTDSEPFAIQIYPEHEPLDLMVRQESYQWEDGRFDDFVGIRYVITNTGTEMLEDLYIGFLADCDVGSRNTPDYYSDDAADSYIGILPTEFGPAKAMLAYAYDEDGDGGATTSYIGAQLLGHPTDPLGARAPAEVGISAVRFFSGDQPFENGGDPTNDFERYELLSSGRFDGGITGDVRLLMSTGPYQQLAPGMSFEIHLALVAGEGLEGLVENAAYAKRFFDGTWFDLDGDPETGIDGKEVQVHWMLSEIVQHSHILDIKPGSCPNPFNVKLFDYVGGENENKGGVLPVAILGSKDFDISDLDISSLRLEGVMPLETGIGYEDVSSPDSIYEECGCEEFGPDGYMDLVMKFNSLDIAEAIMPAGVAGEKRVLTLTGILLDGTIIEATDCIVFVGDEKKDKEGEPELYTASPNPFNPITKVSYYLPERQRIRLSVYDVSGRLIAVIDDGMRDAGEHTVEWNARGTASGVYFSRLEAGVYTRTQKMILLR